MDVKRILQMCALTLYLLLLAAAVNHGVLDPFLSDIIGQPGGVNQGETNATLALAPIGNWTIKVGERLEFSVDVRNGHLPSLSFDVNPLPPGAGFNSTTRRFQWIPTDHQPGLYYLIFTAFNKSSSAFQLVEIRVEEIEISRPPDLSAKLPLTLLLESLNATRQPRIPSDAAVRGSRVWTVNPGESISRAITTSAQGDVIVVNGGYYRENINLDKSLALLGVNGPVIDGGKDGSPLSITIGGAIVDGFTLVNSGDRLYGAGIKISSNRNLITNNSIHDNRDGILLISGSHTNVIATNEIYNNTRTGIFDDNAPEVSIRENVIVNNKGAGINIDLGYSATVLGNRVGFNGGQGVALNQSILNTIRNNRLFENRDTGLWITGGGMNRVQGNRVDDNGSDGIILMNSQDPDLLGYQITDGSGSAYLNFITNNSAERNYGQGIFVRGASVVIDNNTLKYNNHGIRVDWGAVLVSNNVADGNSLGISLIHTNRSAVRGNLLIHNAYGLFVAGFSFDNHVTMNTVTDNSDTGVYLTTYTERNLIRDNIVFNNTRRSIEDDGYNILGINEYG